MSACGSSLRHIFDTTLPDKSSSSSSSSSLLDTLSSSFRHITSLKPPADHSFTEIFGELHFKDNNLLSSSSKISEGVQQDENVKEDRRNVYQGSYHRSDSFSSLNSESLQLCTEGLGSESLGDVEDLKSDFSSGPSWQNHNQNNKYNNNNNINENNNKCEKNNNKMGEKMPVKGYSGYQYRKGKSNGKTFPPPISCIGKTGKPCVCFQSFRQDGRFVLKEMKIPTHERLHASREDGRLRLCFVQPSDQDDDDDDDDTGEVVEDEDDGSEDEGAVEEDVDGRRAETEVRDDVERGHS
ncbi:hypothetical protein RND81_05G252100 [Saponaria officinalis]|uniref:FAF domain-containing protein n=1 Tax=Saponaria officinalis TaxID=3572 RepID=A0AAW1L1L8_SAPOF